MRHFVNKNYYACCQVPRFTNVDWNLHCNSVNYQKIMSRIEYLCNIENLLPASTELMSGSLLTISKLFDFHLPEVYKIV